MRVGLLGDSQGVGLKGPLERALVPLGADLVVAVTQVGAPLRTLTSLADDLPRGLDLVVVVCGGGNDTSSLSSPERWREDVRGLVAAVLTRGPRRIVWVGPFPAREGVGTSAAQAKVAARGRLPDALAGLPITRIDGFELSRGVAPSPSDGLHFSSSSYATLAARLAPLLLSNSGPSVAVVVGVAAGGLALLGAFAWALTHQR